MLEEDDLPLRPSAPEKITSLIAVPRSCFADVSPKTQRTASMILDLPQPFGPTMAVMLCLNVNVVGLANDLNPANFKEG